MTRCHIKKAYDTFNLSELKGKKRSICFLKKRKPPTMKIPIQRKRGTNSTMLLIARKSHVHESIFGQVKSRWTLYMIAHKQNNVQRDTIRKETSYTWSPINKQNNTCTCDSIQSIKRKDERLKKDEQRPLQNSVHRRVRKKKMYNVLSCMFSQHVSFVEKKSPPLD